MNTQHKVGCTDLGCPGCDAGDPPSVTEPEKCLKCHSTAKRIFHKPCDNGSMTNPTKKAHPWHNAVQPEPREEQNVAGHIAVLRANDSFGDSDGGRGGSSKLAIANTPQPDLEEGFVEIFVAEPDPEFRPVHYVSWRNRREGWLAARRLSPDRKLVEALQAILDLEPFHAHMEPSEYVRRVDEIAEAALKTQELAPEVIEACRCLLQHFIPHTGKLYRFVSSCDLCETQEPTPKEK